MSSEELDKYRVYMEEFRKNMDVSEDSGLKPKSIKIINGGGTVI